MRARLAFGVVVMVAASGLVALPAAQAAPGDAAPAGAHSWLPPTPANWPLVVDSTRTPDRTITRGVTQHAETIDSVGGRQRAQILSVDASDRNVRLGVVEAGDKLIDPADETVTSMAKRTGAVAGINAGFFDIHASGQPESGTIVDGRVWKSPQHNFNASLGVRPDGSMVIGPQEFTGTVTDGAATHALNSINWTNDAIAGAITEVTSDLGGPTALSKASTLVLGSSSGSTLTVTSVATVASLPALTTGTTGLLAAGAGGSWLSANVHVGDTVAIGSHISPDDNLQSLVTGAVQIVKDGAVYTDPTGGPPAGLNPETAVGISKDGKHAIFLTLDGHQAESVAEGVVAAQVAGYLVQLGADSAVLLDGGGSTEMIARRPGDTATSVQNTPSDGTERPVANGLFIYSTAEQAGPAVKTVINQGKPYTAVAGAPSPLSVYATDASGNPAATAPSVSIAPPSLGSWTDGVFTPNRAGDGAVIARSGNAVAVEPISVVDRLRSLTITPDQPDLNNGGTQQFTLSGVTASGTSVDVPARAATWTVSRPDLGSVDADGLFTATTSGGGLLDVTASAGGAQAKASVAVGSAASVLNEMSDPSAWTFTTHGGTTATLGSAPGDVPPGSTAPASLKFDYDFPAGAGVHQLVFWPKTDLTIGANPDGQLPTGLGLWVKGTGGHDGFQLASSYVQVNGQSATLYNPGVTYNGWSLLVTQLPPGTQFPLTLDFLDFLNISPTTEAKGSVEVANFSALYSPRPPAPVNYTAIPDNPRWLQYEESARAFGPNGQTMLVGDDAHLVASDPGSTSANVMNTIGQRLPTLPANARPDVVQAMGDMPDDGALADLQFAHDKLSALGVPFRDAVGNHEISQGGIAENTNFAQVFGDTHYAYTLGSADVIVTDNAHGGITASDPYQVPAGAQYPWLVQQLNAATSPVVVVATHMPAYDPHPVADSQFADRWEAQMYLQLVDYFQRAHRQQHVVMVYGHARGFAEQILDPEGHPTDAAHGIPQLTIADLGMPAYATADQGGFYNFSLLHFRPDGTVQFSVEPVLASATVDAPATIAVGHSATLTATGTCVQGDNLPALTMPIADPASHVWTSSDPRVARVDARTGQVTALHPGAVTITVTSGGVSASATVTVP